MASYTVSAAVAQTVAFLTNPLVHTYPGAVLSKLQVVLEANLTAYYAPTWSSLNPSSGSGRRALTLSLTCLPPRVVYSACMAAGVQWFEWFQHLKVAELDLFVDPGHVCVRLGAEMHTVWKAGAAVPMLQPRLQTKTVAQQLMADDDDVLDLINSMNDMDAPLYRPEPFAKARTPSPFSSLSSSSGHSRSSSRSSSEYCPYSSDSDESMTDSEVYVDTSKNAVTPYDGGKTTVLTGGVMLGAAPALARPKHANAPRGSWRVGRA
ncbi:hypothetical protein CYLTODRAFT_454310 [Cylindrobasidium torrendii FP15055 ss-10]|uniref:Anti-proliferative protein domain-containing protein n=1 Tax=Cylindrobasidium torrendii FP15055 ss-10 TaxID=1314674 RepID=A0A0D7BAJ5_9AGAR|nr:hypothetical protein CYLTODRAFT_454310 [Cylindrobasidium torrendii FP15055 ss-10]